MNEQSLINKLYTWAKVLTGVLIPFRLTALALERFALVQWGQLMGFLDRGPAPVSNLLLLVQRQALLTWLWEHCWIVFLGLLLLPWLLGLLKPLLQLVPFTRDLFTEVWRSLFSAVRRFAGWVFRVRCRSVTLSGCQYVRVGHLDGSEELVNIREQRIWHGWQQEGALTYLSCSDEGEVRLVWSDGFRTLEDREALNPGKALKERYPELQAVETITLYDDRR